MVDITIMLQKKRNFDRNSRMHGQFFNHEIASFTKWNWKKSKFCMVVKSHLLYIFVKNQACFQTYPSISDFYRFCETGSEIKWNWLQILWNWSTIVVGNIPTLYDVFFEFYRSSLNNDIKSKEFMQDTKFYGLFYLKN